MKVILFGATGMVGQGALRACLADPEVTRVLCVGRSASGATDPKVTDLVVADLTDFSAALDDLTGYDACFFCLGVSAVGMTEAAYRKVTYDITLAAARALVARNPAMTFLYVSGAGTDATERGRTMWARVKGETENALAKLPFRAVYLLRPGYIQPKGGIVSRTPLYRTIYAVVGPIYPLLNALLPAHVTTTEQVGRAMIAVAKRGAPKPILENRDLNALAG